MEDELRYRTINHTTKEERQLTETEPLLNKQYEIYTTNSNKNNEIKQRIQYDYVSKIVKSRENEYTIEENADVWVGTWNVNGSFSKQDIELWLSSKKTKPFDLYVVGLQEMVPLNPLTVLFNLHVNSKRQQWITTIKEVLSVQYNTEFSCISSLSLVGITILLFTPNTTSHSFTDIHLSKVPTGFYGLLGNKGGIGISLHIDQTRTCFICSHLTAHKQYVKEREHDFNKIWRELFWNEDRVYFENDIMFGDLNYRLDVNRTSEDVINEIAMNSEELIQYDQLTLNKSHGGAFSCFSEHPIHFNPTYKYKKGSTEYTPKRCPAWCDRILYIGNCCVHTYKPVNNALCSDHKPVLSEMQFTVKKYDETKRNELQTLITDELIQANCHSASIIVETPVLDFGQITVNSYVKRVIRLHNRLNTNAFYQFLPNRGQLSKSWYTLETTEGLIKPYETKEIEVILHITPAIARRLARGYGMIDDHLVLCILDEGIHTIQCKATLQHCSDQQLAWKTLLTKSGCLLLSCIVTYIMMDCYFKH